MIGPALLALATAAAPTEVVDYAGDAKALDQIIVENYAYEGHWPNGELPDSEALRKEREAVRDRDSLLRYAEHRIASLADHHAITGSSFRDSWALVPTYADLWIELRNSRFVIDAVRPSSPAEAAGVRAGDELLAVDGVPVAKAVADYWDTFGLEANGQRLANGARVLVAGRRDRSRVLTIGRSGSTKIYRLPSFYSVDAPDQPPVTVSKEAGRTIIKLNNSLGQQETIEAFDRAMSAVDRGVSVTIDLSDTPSGGNTSVARAMMGWFVTKPTPYQIHTLPAEERETGIARQWIEQVLPRQNKYHSGPVLVRVGRWTGSMGEGLAIGFKAIGAAVCGDRMAGLKGAVYDFTLPSSGMMVKFPAERLFSVWGQPREEFVPDRCQ